MSRPVACRGAIGRCRPANVERVSEAAAIRSKKRRTREYSLGVVGNERAAAGEGECRNALLLPEHVVNVELVAREDLAVHLAELASRVDDGVAREREDDVPDRVLARVDVGLREDLGLCRSKSVV